MKFKSILALALSFAFSGCVATAPVRTVGGAEAAYPKVSVGDAFATVVPVAGTPVRVSFITDKIVHVVADPDGDFARDESLMVVAQDKPDGISVKEADGAVELRSTSLVARVDGTTGKVSFLHPDGRPILSEAPAREFSAKTVGGEPFYAVRQVFASDPGEGFYGLGQHQMGQMNFNGENVELAQHNVAIAMPFLISTGDYGILWDNSSITRFGDPRPFAGLDDTLVVRDRDGAEGGLTGEYYYEGELVATTQEGDPDYQFLPEDQFATGAGERDVFPAPLGTKSPDKVVWTGSVEAETAGLHKFQVYGSSYIKVTVDGEEVVNRWRQNWNPNNFNFELEMAPGKRHAVEIEWLPNDGYFRIMHLDPIPEDERNALSLSSEVAQVLDYYFILGPSADEIISGYRQLTGKSVMLPRWAYGFWQSRQRYTTQDELLDALAEYRARDIPIDNIVLDWFYWREDDWGSHKFDPARFPDPGAMVDAVHDMHAQVMISVWPKFYPTTDNYKALDEKGCIYRGNIERGALDWVGPGYLNAFVDQYSEECRRLFWSQMQREIDALGFDAWWMDATEPDMHSNVSHADRAYRMGPTAMGPAEQYFNSFVLMNSRAVYEGERAGTEPDERVFILTRSAFPGIQRYASASWSGDIVARWDDLREQISAGVNFSMSGTPNWTHDIGGFSVEQRYSSEDPAHVDEWRELNTRWYQFGAFSPIFRSHGEYPFREVYNLAEDGSAVQNTLIAYDKLRYRLMPYIYTLAADTYHKDGTIMRGLVMDFENDPVTWDIADQYMFGPAFLVSPVHEYKARSRSLYLPAGADWYDFLTGTKYAGGQWIQAAAPLDWMPLYVKAGSIVPMGPDIQYTAEGIGKEVSLFVFTGANGSFELYDDDGETYAYERGEWSRIPIRWDESEQQLIIGDKLGEFGGQQEFKVHFVTPGTGNAPANSKPDSTAIYSGRKIVIEKTP
ncbi:MAG: glycoside hydrolase family 31 protein [Hyphomonas sp.]|uniref:TIM-barrel domain-containing protein n=1 Tax=Hyphomonas sp. TaxID=87 RepID=UPI003528D240